MTNEEWCRTVLERVFPKSTIPSQPLPPALYGIAGKIWRDWQQMKGFTQTTDVFARNNPSFPPDPMWLAKVAVSAGWRTLTTQSFDPWFRDRKSTRLNSSHLGISYAVFCLKKTEWRRSRKHRQDGPKRSGHARGPGLRRRAAGASD